MREGCVQKEGVSQGLSASDELYWEWLCGIPGLYRAQQEVLLRCFGSPRAVWEATSKELELLERKGCRWVGRVAASQRAEPPEEKREQWEGQGIHFVSSEGGDYPDRLRHLKNRPYGLFYRGKLPDRRKKAVAIVGARVCTSYGKEMAEQLARRTAQCGGTVISGAAYGVDGAAQWAALEAGGESFAVMGCGVDICYPASHARLLGRLGQEGGILSEFPPGTEPLPRHFPMRNRIISGLADVVAVVEARKKSGSLITADFAAEQGRQVMAVPGRTDDDVSQGCNELLAQGAGMILSVDSFAEDIFPEMSGIKRKFTDNISLAPAEKLVYSSLGLHSKSIWELAECTPLSLAELSESLLSLEQKGLVREGEPNYYVRAR